MLGDTRKDGRLSLHLKTRALVGWLSYLEPGGLHHVVRQLLDE